jgi:DNA-binding GntR family transcriptional regulator
MTLAADSWPVGDAAPQSSAIPAPKAARSRSSEVYGELRRALLLGKYPLFERLAEVRLAEQFEASRTPVREALVRLESEGLVIRRPEGGFYPRSPNLADVRDLYELRRMIELASLAQPRENGTTHDKGILRAIHDDWSALAAKPPHPDPDFVLLDERFHVVLATAAGNRAVADHLQMINERIRVVRMHNFIHAVRIEVTASQHLAIIDALLAADPDHAIALMTAHLDEALQQASGRVAAALERMLTAGVVLNPDTLDS